METDLLFPGNKKAPDLDKLLNLIEEGDAAEVLSEDNLQYGFNELLKFELVAIKDETIHLTELGRQAKVLGVQQVIEKVKTRETLAAVAVPVTARRNVNKKARFYYLLLVFALLFLYLVVVALP